jgi:type I restriction enzyme S subunit
MASESVIGTIPADWETLTLGTVVKRGGGLIQTGPFGSELHASDYVLLGIPSIMPTNIGENRVVTENISRITPEDAKRLNRYLVRNGDIVYSRRGDIERRALIREQEEGWLCGTGCLMVRLGNDSGVDPVYASYYLSHPAIRQWLVQHAVGDTMPNLNIAIMQALPFVVPPPHEQTAILQTLSSLDDKIDLNQRTNRLLEGLARAIFRAWFIDFEPVKAKAVGATAFRGMPEDIFEQLPDKFAESEVGPIPDGWTVEPLSKLVELFGGGTPKRKVAEYWGGNIPWFSVRDAPTEGDVWVIDTEDHITQAGVDNSSTKLMRAGTTIISARGTVGRLAMAAVPMAMNQSCYGVQGAIGIADLFVYFTLHHAVEELQQRTHGSVFDTITRDTFDVLNRVRPKPQVLAAFETTVAPYVQLIRNNLLENRTLARIRDALLPRLISGMIRVPSSTQGAGDGR